jgi:type IV pilus biogenesis protein CpaD/CtpE
MEVEMSDPNALQDNDMPRETRIPQPAEVTETNKVPQILVTIAGIQFSTSDPIMGFSGNYSLQRQEIF